jgi:hypothetical protein
MYLYWMFNVLARQLSRGLSRPLSIDLDGITRIVFIDLDDTASAHYLLGTPFVASADYSIEYLVYFVGNSIRVTGNTSGFNSRTSISSGGEILWRPASGGDEIASGASVLPLNKLSLIKVERLGSVGNIYINNTLVKTATSPTFDCTINSIGNQGGASSGGLISRPELIDLTTPANSQYYKLNQLTANSETSGANTLTYQNIALNKRDTYELSSDGTKWVSSEFVNNGWNDVTANVTASNQSVYFNAVDTSYIYARQPIVFTAGYTYLIEVVVSNYVSGEVNLQAKGVSAEDIVLNIDASKSFTYTPTSSNTVLEIQRAVGTTAVMDVSISIKRKIDIAAQA